MGEACSIYGKVKSGCKIWLASLRRRDYSEDLGIDRRIMLNRS
jgi:hypothetical protein